ncbi:sugar ABC transporter substrate-binding protein [Martelella sp. AD-3]|uniref:sugar ABC transporter substrate-binding protein n=1 Tax=Martelella sp. AD-3 TaxID=686597 RepID=UPI0004637D21|nr:sugar ABC transporter substrate-binding protein [Martelella sp. AD-3]AMM85590.1 sugar ABC transporter substrate-binding protein [Martelella sp. AD-3]
MKTAIFSALVTSAFVAAASPSLADDAKLLGIVSIAANEANNVRYINGAKAAAEELGWDVDVVDAAGSADQANSAIQNFAGRGAVAIIDMVFPYSSIGAGLAAADSAGIPVVTWGGGLGRSVASTNGSGAPIAAPVIDKMIANLNSKGEILALTYRTGEVCRNREVLLDEKLKDYPDIKVTKNEVRIPGYLEDGAQYANAWLASRPPGGDNLAIWGCWDDPAIGAIGPLRQQGRTDVEVYGVNGNAQALENIRRGHMTATAWEDSYTEGYDMVMLLEKIIDEGDAWEPKAVEVPAILVTQDNIETFLKEHPDAYGN